ncbi:hypothetical protein ACH5RR_020111 [Cinchona calisaya]|uniref:non-specific serine/threonine protein kinase n=1 Tax=Cinchona calisaya TaxID=153742 RepID=A0ABD2ZGI5_9GENT
MHPMIFFLIFLSLQSQFTLLSARKLPAVLQNGNASSTSCPLDFNVLRKLIQGSKRPNLDTTSTHCQYIRQGLRLVLSDYLKRTNSFLPPLHSAESCWRAYQSLVNDFVPKFDIRRSCGFQTSWIAEGCIGITTRAEFESSITSPALNLVVSNCNQSLENGSPCAACTPSLSSLLAYHLTGRPSVGNLTDCTAYGSIYAAAFANQFGPTDKGTAKCLFSLDFTAANSSNKKKKIIISVVGVAGAVVFVVMLTGFWFYYQREKGKLSGNWKSNQVNPGSGPPVSSLVSISGSGTNLVRFTLVEIKAATKNFSSENIIGRGGYGNVFKGVFPDGSEVAVKRFKNCSASGDEIFTHEVEVIASVRHVNLVALRGYCVATTPYEGHQRIIICDLIKNGNLHDHLFGLNNNKLSWPIRRKIALGMARGLAYLHYGAHHAIIHRDIKPSNILLDESFEPKVADFGLAKFTQEGMTHLSTRVAGTMGYVAPEYALYGQLTERSDVYSFGVVLLELLSGKKAVMATNDGQPIVTTDWAWSLVRNGRTLDVIEDGIPDLDPPEVLEKYVLIAVLCSHPQLYARPTMDQVVKMLDTEDVPVPSIPERPVPLTADTDVDIQSSAASSSGSGHLLASNGVHPSSLEKENPVSPKEKLS